MKLASHRPAVTSLGLSTLLVSLGTSSANVALPTFVVRFHASFQAVQWIVLAYLVAMTASIVGAGRLGDSLGRRRSLGAGLLIFTVAALVAGMAPGLWVVVGARAVQGVGAAMMMALTLALVRDTVPADRIGAAMGLVGTMSAIGTALGPSLGGALLRLFGWRAIFLVNVPPCLVDLYLARRFLPRDAPLRPTGARFDVEGTVSLALVLAVYALAMTLGRGQLSAVNIALLIAACVGGMAFVVVENRAPAPLVRLGLLRDRALTSSLGTNLLVSAIAMATLVVGPFHLAAVYGLDPWRVGLAMSAGPVTSALTGVPAGRLVDRVGSRRTTLVGLAVLAVGTSLLAIVPDRVGVVGYAAPVAVTSSGYALFQAANNAAVMRYADARESGLVAAILNLSRNLGLVTGTCVMGAVFVRFGMHVTFALAAALAVLGLGIVAIAPERTAT